MQKSPVFVRIGDECMKTEAIKKLVAALDELALADIDQLDQEELKRVEENLYNWQQLCRLRLERGQ